MKKVVALVLALTLLTGCAVIDDGYLEVVDPKPDVTTTTTGDAVSSAPFTLSLGTVMGKTGAVVSVPLSVSAGAYLVNADLVIGYDPASVKPVMGEDRNLGPAIKADWQAGLWCGEQEAGVLRLMLADAEDGAAEAMTLCTLQFEVLAGGDIPLMLNVTAAGVCAPDGEQADAVKADLVTAENGQIASVGAQN